jgi:hypothetical protein
MDSQPFIVALSVVGAVTGLFGLGIALVQARLSHHASTLAALLPLYERYQSNDMRRVRRTIYFNDYDFEALTPDQEDEIRLLMADIELLSVLVNEKIVSLAVVRALFSPSLPAVYGKVKVPWIDAQRDPHKVPEPASQYARNFQTLIERYDRV